MKLTSKEKELIKFLVKKELKIVEKQEEEIRPPVRFLAAEERYEEVFKNLLKKLK